MGVTAGAAQEGTGGDSDGRWTLERHEASRRAGVELALDSKSGCWEPPSAVESPVQAVRDTRGGDAVDQAVAHVAKCAKVRRFWVRNSSHGARVGSLG